MNKEFSSMLQASPPSKLFLNAMALAGLAVVLGHERVVSDTWITTKVTSEILKSSLAKGCDVKVTTLHGIVTC